MKMNDIKFTPKANAFADVYGKATGMPFVGEIVAAAAGNGGEPTPPTPVPGEFGELQIYRSADVPPYDFNAVMQCTGDMPINNKYYFTTATRFFELNLIVDPNDNTRLIMDVNDDNQHIGDLDEGETGTTLPCTIADRTTWHTTEGPAATYRVMN